MGSIRVPATSNTIAPNKDKYGDIFYLICFSIQKPSHVLTIALNVWDKIKDRENIKSSQKFQNQE